MSRTTRHGQPMLILLVLALCTIASTVPAQGYLSSSVSTEEAAYIVQSTSAASAASAVVVAGGSVTQPLSIINGVVAKLDRAALGRLERNPQLVLRRDEVVQAVGGGRHEKDTEGYLLYPAATTGAHLVHERKVTGPKTKCAKQSDKTWRITTASGQEERKLQGWGVTVAVVDSGFMQMKNPNDWDYKDPATGTLVAANLGRCIVYRDFLPRTSANDNTFSKLKDYNSTDQNGHGTHVISTIADNREAQLAANMNPTPVGVAPQVNLMIARVLDKDGVGSYSDVIAAIQWIIENKAAYNVKVLNLSLYAPVSGPYWADPLAQAAMKAWQAGITVVAAAGNDGPTAGTITVPGNVPYVITASALKSGRYTDSGFDELAAYSSCGPTESAFVKPDIVVPATRTIAPMPTDSTLAAQVEAGRIHEKAKVDYKIGKPDKDYAYYQLSGTSMAAAQVSGIAALVLQANPTLTNDQIKYRLMATAQAAWDQSANAPVYSIWEQGAGLIDTQRAVFSTTTELANEGMNIALDLDAASTTHPWGYTTWNEATGQFGLLDPATGQPLMAWDGGSKTWSGGSKTWSGGSKTWSGGSKTWSGSESFWAGSARSWAGKNPATSLSTSTGSFTELITTGE
ncbi:MAG: S8 family peptidase [Chloroflexales bacterium]|nr:S8 family peptidase [Chloroflexales bacterium]